MSACPQCRAVGQQPSFTSASSVLVGVPLCPALLRYEIIGEADGWRGRVVRAFFLADAGVEDVSIDQ